MWPDIIEIVGIRRQISAQMSLAKDDHVIEAFPTDRADQPLRMPVLPGHREAAGPTQYKKRILHGASSM
jgi:hypothetical protein